MRKIATEIRDEDEKEIICDSVVIKRVWVVGVTEMLEGVEIVGEIVCVGGMEGIVTCGTGVDVGKPVGGSRVFCDIIGTGVVALEVTAILARWSCSCLSLNTSLRMAFNFHLFSCFLFLSSEVHFGSCLTRVGLMFSAWVPCE